MPALIQSSYGKGEIAPALYGRVDTAMYDVALKRARNCIIHAAGGVSNRPGTKFVGPVKQSTQCPRLIEFEFNNTDTYVLEFGDMHMRVIRNDAHVLESSPKTITAIGSGTGGFARLTSNAHGFSDGDQVFITGVVGATELNDRHFNVALSTANQFYIQDAYLASSLVPFSDLSTYVSGGTADRVYEIRMPYGIADVFELNFAQQGDTMTITHEDYAVVKLRRIDHDDWSSTYETFLPNIKPPEGLVVTANATGSVVRRYTVTASAGKSANFEESLAGVNLGSLVITGITQANPGVVGTAPAHGFKLGDEVVIFGVAGMTEVNDRRFIVGKVPTTTTFELRDKDTTGYTAYSSSGNVAQCFAGIFNGHATADDTIAWDTVDGAVKYTVYMSENNGLFGFLAETETTSYTNKNRAADLTISPPEFENPFRLPGSFPRATGFYEQRQQFGGSTEKPDTHYHSRTGNVKNFSTSTPGQQDDAITATLSARKVNVIQHFVEKGDLLILTTGQEWRVNSGSDVAFAFDTLRQKPQSNWGSARNIPIVIGPTIMFVQETKSNIRSLGFSLNIDGYTGNDMNILASHLFKKWQIKDWAFARTPEPIIHVVREDGELCCLTFNQEQEVAAWTTWDTQGRFEASCAIRPSVDARDDAVYFVVNRDIGGIPTRYIERTEPRRFNTVKDCYFVDSGLSYDGDPRPIENITLNDPVRIRSTAHGLATGDTVDIDSIIWRSIYDEDGDEVVPEYLNDGRYTVTVIDSNNFDLDGVDGTEFDVATGGKRAYVYETGYWRTPISKVGGLWHLEGEDLAVLADGNVEEGIVVDGGSITLPAPASRIHAGLRYICDIVTLDIEAPNGRGTIQGKPATVGELVLRFEESRGVSYGPTKTKLTDIRDRDIEDLMGSPSALLTGDIRVTLETDWNSNGRIWVRQKHPLPVTLLASIPDVEVGD